MAASSQPMFDFNAGSRPLFAQQVLSLKDVALYDHFWTSSRWSPDGLALAAVDNKRHVHTWLLPQDSFLRNSEAFTKAPSALSAAGAAADSDSDSALAELPSAVSSLSEAEFVDAHAWHPSSCVSNPSWCVFATSSKSQPVHLWDALTGKIQVFDLGHLGDKGTMWRTTACRRSDEGQKGRLSCVEAASPSAASGDSSLLAAGSTDGSIFVYDARADGEALLGLQPALRRGGGASHHATGISCLKWHPGGLHLFSGARQDDTIRCWDLRNTSKAVQTYHRAGGTQQRLHFDVDAAGGSLVSGCANSPMLHVFDVSSGASQEAIGTAAASKGDPSDRVSHVALHPCGVLLATCSGQRHAPTALDSDSSDNSDGECMFGLEKPKRGAPPASQLSVLGTQPVRGPAPDGER